VQTDQRVPGGDHTPGSIAALHDIHLEFRRTGDRRLRETLVEAYLPLASALATRYSRHREAKDDLTQCALLGLVNAVDRFDPDRGVKFTTFAWITITGELKKHYRDGTWTVRVPRAQQELFLAATTATDALTLELGRSPRISEIAERAGATEEDVVLALEVVGAYFPASLDAPSADGTTTAQALSASERGFELVDDRVALSPLVKRLPPRQQLILHLRFNEEMTQLQIGRVVGLGQMQVSRLLARSLASLREWMQTSQLEAV
jgi:RNA polymerase sigma-B factor